MDGLQELIKSITEHRASQSSQRTCVEQTQTKSIRGKYNLSPEALEAHRNDIISVEAAQDLCQGCDGTTCKQTTRGVIPVINKESRRYYTGVAICKWEQERRHRKHIARLFATARVPKAYEHDRFKDYTVNKANAQAVEAARWAVSRDVQQGLFIYGPRGTGKTKLAAIIANEKAQDGQMVLFSSVPDLLSDIRGSYKDGNTAEVIKAARETPCLILDDLGAEHITEWVGEQLFSLLNYRYNEKLQTIVTTNYDAEELSDRLTTRNKYGEDDDTQAQRILSRIYGMCVRVYLGGRDWRQDGAGPGNICYLRTRGRN